MGAHSFAAHAGLILVGLFVVAMLVCQVLKRQTRAPTPAEQLNAAVPVLRRPPPKANPGDFANPNPPKIPDGAPLNPPTRRKR